MARCLHTRRAAKTRRALIRSDMWCVPIVDVLVEMWWAKKTDQMQCRSGLANRFYGLLGISKSEYGAVFAPHFDMQWVPYSYTRRNVRDARCWVRQIHAWWANTIWGNTTQPKTHVYTCATFVMAFVRILARNLLWRALMLGMRLLNAGLARINGRRVWAVRCVGRIRNLRV